MSAHGNQPDSTATLGFRRIDPWRKSRQRSGITGTRRKLVTVRVVRYRNSASLGTTNEMFAEKPRNARVELAVKGGPVEAGRIIGANAR
jgi:hypothetical protein